MKLLGVLSHPSPSLADGLDVISSFGIGYGVFEMLVEYHHESIEVSHLWSITVVEHNHPCAVVPSRSIVTNLILLSSVVISRPYPCM